MTTRLKKHFFDTFGIECNIHFHQQFNGAQVPRGLEFYKEREKLEKEGIIKIWHKMLNPRPENDCIYWGEYHYPQITDKHYLELICELNKLIDKKYGEYKTFISFEYIKLKEEILEECLLHREELKHQVQAIFEGER